MKNLKAGFVAAILIALAVLFYWQHQVQEKLHAENVALALQLAQLLTDNESLSNRLASAGDANSLSDKDRNELLKLRGEVTRLRANTQKLEQIRADNSNDPMESMAKSWLQKVNKLKQQLNQKPDKNIPELQYATDKDWFDATRDADLETDDGVRKALSELRSMAKMQFASMMSEALRNYAKNNNGQLPSNVFQLKAYFSSPIDDSILQRYEMLQAGSLSDARGKYLVTEIAPVDQDYDTRYYIGTSGVQGSDVKDYSPDSPMAQKYPPIPQ